MRPRSARPCPALLCSLPASPQSPSHLPSLSFACLSWQSKTLASVSASLRSAGSSSPLQSPCHSPVSQSLAIPLLRLPRLAIENIGQRFGLTPFGRVQLSFAVSLPFPSLPVTCHPSPSSVVLRSAFRFGAVERIQAVPSKSI